MSTFILCVRHENYYFGKRSQLNYSKLSKSRNFKHNNSFEQSYFFLPKLILWTNIDINVFNCSSHFAAGEIIQLESVFAVLKKTKTKQSICSTSLVELGPSRPHGLLEFDQIHLGSKKFGPIFFNKFSFSKKERKD